jgi:hypothetical protein
VYPYVHAAAVRHIHASVSHVYVGVVHSAVIHCNFGVFKLLENGIEGRGAGVFETWSVWTVDVEYV